MGNSSEQYELPHNIEKYLHALSKTYEHQNKKDLQTIIVNARITVHKKWSHDNWNGGTYGHAIYFSVPYGLYNILNIFNQKEKYQEQIKDDINKIHNIQNEFIEEVFLEIDIPQEDDWRRDSGQLIKDKRTVPIESQNRVWEENGYYRVFLSHQTEYRVEAAELKAKLSLFGITCFVAHEDIEPLKEWQIEIENALFSMDALIALMTSDFHDSKWTDQEVGVAFGREVPIISIKLGSDPYGFIGKFQALSCSIENVPKEIVKYLIKYEKMKDTYISSVSKCSSFKDADTLAELLPLIDSLSDIQISNLIKAFNENSQLRGIIRDTEFANTLRALLKKLGSDVKSLRDV
ncbi:MAG: toll/interleukin-1 receptor domain-containing protein [Nitrospirae bacterium]|nr:toll/interleukin-1 receptor domain-containing protein [Nitrospirota bacterium]